MARYGGLGVGACAGVPDAGLGGLAALRGAVDSPRRARPAAGAEALVQGSRRGSAGRGRRGLVSVCKTKSGCSTRNIRCRVTGGRKQGGSRPSPHAVAG